MEPYSLLDSYANQKLGIKKITDAKSGVSEKLPIEVLNHEANDALGENTWRYMDYENNDIRRSYRK